MEEKNITRILESLILEYEIEKYHPRFKVKVQSERLIGYFVEKYSSKEWILIVRSKTDSDYFCNVAIGAEIRQVIKYNELTNETVKKLEELQKKCVIIVASFYGRYRVMNELQNHRIKSVSLYDYFENKGVISTGNYYDVFGDEYSAFHGGEKTFDYSELDINSIFFYDRRRYENSVTKEYKELYLAKMIFDCAYARDIEKMNECIQEYVKGGYRNFKQYQEFSKAVDSLMFDIAKKIKSRRKKDVVVFWLDALEYGDDKEMPWLSSLSEKALDFEQAYTVTPYTHSTARTLFCGKYVVDDRAYNMEIDGSCRLASQMKKRGYQVLFYTFLNQVKDDIKGRRMQNIYTPLSQICWDFLCDLLTNENAVFAVIHEVLHTHSPYISLGLTGTEYSFTERMGIVTSHEDMIRKEQMEESRKSTDLVLKYYSDLLHENMFKIYMSDHGHTYLDKFHTILRIVQKDLKPKKIKKIFSYISFCKLIEKLIDNDNNFKDIFSEYAKVQDIDYYYKEYIKRSLTQSKPQLMTLFGYEGIVSDRGYYLRYNDGHEEYYSHKNGKKISKEYIEAAMDICPRYPDELIQDDKFKYSRNVYRTLNKYLARNQNFEYEKIRVICSVFEDLPEEATVALRGGGMHSYRLWLALPWNLKKRITFVIDRDIQCMAGRVGIKVISLDQIREKMVSHIVISSFEYEDQWTKELIEQEGDIKVIGLYQELRRRGVYCNDAFYHKEYIKEDIVWEE